MFTMPHRTATTTACLMHGSNSNSARSLPEYRQTLTVTVFRMCRAGTTVHAAARDDAEEDRDNDGLTNYWEIQLSLGVNNPDSDGDRYLDGDEDSDPNPQGQPGDGFANRLDAHPNEKLIAWPRVSESRYAVAPLEIGGLPTLFPAALNSKGEVVALSPACNDPDHDGFWMPMRVFHWQIGQWVERPNTIEYPDSGAYIELDGQGNEQTNPKITSSLPLRSPISRIGFPRPILPKVLLNDQGRSMTSLDDVRREGEPYPADLCAAEPHLSRLA